MTSLQATAEVFWTAFKALPKSAREDFMLRLVEDRQAREDIMDLAVIEQRRSEKVRPLSEYITQRSSRK